jgi:uncharacterized membrane protein YidH (DUF202 family)
MPGLEAAQGAAIERTRLAWRRTMLVFSIVEVVLIVTIAHRGVTPLRALALGVGLVVWLGCLLITQRRIRTMDRTSSLIRDSDRRDATPPGIGRTITLVGLAVTLLAALGLLVLP